MAVKVKVLVSDVARRYTVGEEGILLVNTFPEDMQRLALQAVKEEHDRLARGDYTPQEQEMFDLAKAVGAQCRHAVDQIAFEALTET